VSDALCDVVDILGGDTANRDTSVLSHVNAVLLNHGFALLEGQTSEGEHANLSGDVRPVSLDTSLLDGCAKSQTHIVHSLANNNEFVKPLLAQRHVV